MSNIGYYLEVIVNKIRKNKYYLDFPYQADLIENIKSLDKREYDPNNKKWSMDSINLYNLIMKYKGKKDIFFKFEDEDSKKEFISVYNENLLKFKKKEELLLDEMNQQELNVNIKQELRNKTFEELSDLTGFKDILNDGILPYKYQLEGSIFLLESKKCLLAADMGLGKAQPLDSKILTPKGFVLMKDIKIGDEIINSKGGISHVIGVYPQGFKDVYKITFSDDSSTECCGEHLWKVITPTKKIRNKGYNIMSTNTLLNNGIKYDNKNKKYFIPIINKVNFSKQELPIPPYIMGCLLGDGGFTVKYLILFSNIDQEILDNIKNLLHDSLMLQPMNKIDYHIKNKNNINGIKKNKNIYNNYIKDLGLCGLKSKDKFIPDIYKYTSIEDRIEMLQGLMDTDGTVDKKCGSIFYNSTSKRLINDIVFIVESLGGTVKKQKLKVDQKGFKSHNITISLPDDILPFKLTRKLKFFKPKTKYKPFRGFKSIEKLDNQKECQCISVDSDDNLYVTDDFILTHNTLISITAIEMLKDDVSKVLIIVPNSLKYNWFNEITKFTKSKCHILNEKKKSNNKYTLEESKYIIINYEYFRSADFSYKDKIGKYGIDEIKVMICDESHSMKNTKSNTTHNIRKSFKDLDYIFLLTGTPMPNKIEELFVQLNFMLPNQISSKSKFYQDFCGLKYDPGTREYVPISEDSFSLDKINKRLDTVMFRLKKKDVLKDLPTLRVNTIYLDLTDQQRKEYNEIESGIKKVNWNNEINELEETDNKDTSFLGISTKLRQYTSLCKIDYLEETIKTLNSENEKIVVFDQFKKPLETIWKRFGKNSYYYHGEIDPKMRQNMVDKFQMDNDDIMNMFITIGSGNFGITLTRSSTMFLMTLPFVPGQLEQIYARLHRIGQLNTVNVYKIIYKDTIDEYLDKIIDRKMGQINKVVDNEEYVKQNNISAFAELMIHYKKKYK